MKNRVRIGMDLDGVVYNWESIFRFMARHHHGIELPTPTSWQTFPELMPRVEWDWMWSEGVAAGMFRYGSLYKGSREALKAIADIADLVVITSRPPQAQADTLDWLAFQKFPAAEVHILSDRAKSTVPCDIYVDDASHNAVELLANTDAFVVLPDRPYNQDTVDVAESGTRLYRTYDWAEAVSVVSYLVGRIESRIESSR